MQRFKYPGFLSVTLTLLFWLLSFQAAATSAKPLILSHELQVVYQPDSGKLAVSDEFAVPSGMVEFTLNANFLVKQNGRLLKPVGGKYGLLRYRLSQSDNPVKLEYSGKLKSTPDCNWLTDSCMKADTQGLFLSASSGWYPDFKGAMHQFSLQTKLPNGWKSISQGEKLKGNGWAEKQPQQSIYLIAAPFIEYSQRKGDVEALVYLLKPDEKLARQYLDATDRYIRQYSELLGDYPYDKFATIESFWPSGWGMPSFTLLGSQVMRLPFILYTSFPHEILHNWWGNGVYVDLENGNWSEGLTAYLSDHYLRELKGEGASYRRDQLNKYRLFSSEGNDFPLSEFVSRHDRASQAIGYGKSMMIFHSIRNQIGNEAFFAGLKRFYRENRFGAADFNELIAALLKGNTLSTNEFVSQWLERKGIPKIELVNAGRVPASNLNAVKIVLKQSQPSQVYPMSVPVEVTFTEGGKTDRSVQMNQRETTQVLEFNKPVCRVAVDPDFDRLRIPLKDELPATLNTLFALEGKTLRVAGPDSHRLKEVKPALARLTASTAIISGNGSKPDSDAILWFGNTASLPGEVSAQLQWQNDSLLLRGKPIDSDSLATVLALTYQQKPFFWLASPSQAATHTLLRKLRHYGKYSYLAFDAASGRNRIKGQWEVKSSSLTADLAVCGAAH